MPTRLKERHFPYPVPQTQAQKNKTQRTAWRMVTADFNANELNQKRTEAQLKKCWDNLKTKRKRQLSNEKIQRLKTGGGSFVCPIPSNSIVDDAITSCTDIELRNVIDCDRYQNTEDSNMVTCEIDRDTETNIRGFTPSKYSSNKVGDSSSRKVMKKDPRTLWVETEANE